jgi:NAD(P)-dependent dehydrogenase (short-subunit alcohol dehydrogenase family)
MTDHPALAPGRVAVITGAASGIGLAAAQKFALLGMKVCMADANAEGLKAAAQSVRTSAKNPDEIREFPVDVSNLGEVQNLKNAAYAAFGEVAVLMNNAGVGDGGGVFAEPSRWRRIIDINFWGALNGVQAFGPAMIAQGTPCAIVNTGSKQGITTPPGDAAYNVSKAGVKIVTEALAYELREIAGCKVSAHLLIPGFTFTGISTPSPTKPPGAWTAEQVIDFLLPAMGKGDFYVLCPDNDVTREMDEKRMFWAAHDIIENRPALSRWHPDYKDAFAEFMKAPRPKA